MSGNKDIWPDVESTRAVKWSRLGAYKVYRLRAGGWAAVWEWIREA